MKTITIVGKKREIVGKSDTRALRNAEKVPCVVYGATEPINFSADEKSFKNLVYTPDAHKVSIQIEGAENIDAVLQDIQFHPVTDRILHADFYQITDKKPVTMKIPVELTGRSTGIIKGGSLNLYMRKLKIKALHSDIPEKIVIDITDLDIGDKTYVSAIKSDKFTFLHPDNAVIVAVKNSRTATKTEEAEESTETEEATEEATTES